MALQARSIRPKLGEPDDARVERVFRHVVGNAAVVPVGRVHQRFQVRPNVRQPLGREPQDANHGDCGLQGSRWHYAAAT